MALNQLGLRTLCQNTVRRRALWVDDGRTARALARRGFLFSSSSSLSAGWHSLTALGVRTRRALSTLPTSAIEALTAPTGRRS